MSINVLVVCALVAVARAAPGHLAVAVAGPGEHGVVVKGPITHTNVHGPDGSFISAVADSGAVVVPPKSGGVVTADVAPGYVAPVVTAHVAPVLAPVVAPAIAPVIAADLAPVVAPAIAPIAAHVIGVPAVAGGHSSSSISHGLVNGHTVTGTHVVGHGAHGW